MATVGAVVDDEPVKKAPVGGVVDGASLTRPFVLGFALVFYTPLSPIAKKPPHLKDLHLFRDFFRLRCEVDLSPLTRRVSLDLTSPHVPANSAFCITAFLPTKEVRPPPCVLAELAAYSPGEIKYRWTDLFGSTV